MKKTRNERMLDIMKSLESVNEVYNYDEKDYDENKVLLEKQRIKLLSSEIVNEDFKEIKENYYIAGKFGTGGRGKTVNSMIDDYRDVPSTSTPKVSPSNLKPHEALEVCIKRVLKSGTPINNISFYDEVNWNLMNLGFPAVNEIDIKNTILGMIGE